MPELEKERRGMGIRRDGDCSCGDDEGKMKDKDIHCDETIRKYH